MIEKQKYLLKHKVLEKDNYCCLVWEMFSDTSHCIFCLSEGYMELLEFYCTPHSPQPA